MEKNFLVIMNQGQLLRFEQAKNWDAAIELLQGAIASHPHDIDIYIAMNYLLMNLLVEEQYDSTKHDEYAALAKKYFDESYSRFSENPEYLFFTGITAVMSEWYFGITVDDYKFMLNKAMILAPDNPIYQRTYYIQLDESDPKNRKPLIDYANTILHDDWIRNILENKGAVGQYLLDIMTNWSLRILEKYKCADHQMK